MKLFEYQIKELFHEVGIPVPNGRLARSPEGAEKLFQDLSGKAVLKAQVLSGGRGKAGGIYFPESPENARVKAKELFQFGIKGLDVNSILVEETVDIESELYLSLTIDSRQESVVMMIGSMGGVDVEEAADDTIYKCSLDISFPVFSYQIRNALYKLKLPIELTSEITSIAQNLMALSKKYCSTLIEINPLVLSSTGDVIALDAKMIVDNNSIPLLPDIQKVIRSNPEHYAQELIKMDHGFDYVELDSNGQIGIISTGAGLTMAVIDMIKDLGGTPINFTDMRTGGLKGDPTRIEIAIEKMTREPTIKVIFINVFAGITDLYEFSETLLKALMKFQNLKVNILVRIEGNNFENAKKLLASEGIEVYQSLDEAVKRVIALGGVNGEHIN